MESINKPDVVIEIKNDKKEKKDKKGSNCFYFCY